MTHMGDLEYLDMKKNLLPKMPPAHQNHEIDRNENSD